MLVISDARVLSELQNLVDALAKVAARPGSPESLQQLVEIAKDPATNIASLSSVSAGKEDVSLQPSENKVIALPSLTHLPLSCNLLCQRLWEV